MTYHNTKYNIILDLESNIYHTLPEVDMKRLIKLTISKDDTDGIETEGVTECSVRVKMCDRRYTAHAYPLVAYRDESVKSLAEGVLKLAMDCTDRTTGITYLNKDITTDVEVSLYPLISQDDKQSIVYTLKQKVKTLEALVDRLAANHLAHYAYMETSELEPQCTPCTSQTQQTQETLEVFAHHADSDGHETPEEIEELRKSIFANSAPLEVQCLNEQEE